MLLRRVLCLAASILLGAAPCLVPALSETLPAFAMAGFDGDNSARDWRSNGFFIRMEERTGITFTFSQYDDYAKWQEAKAEMFRTGDLPDVLFKAELTTEEQARYTDSGQLLDLKPLLETHAPNLWALLSAKPEYLAAITLPSGKIGALPAITELPAQNAMWINQDWLDRLRLPMPTDAESLRETLRAFQTLDPNQNGKRDEIPLAFYGVWDLKFLSHAFGVAVNDYNLYVDAAGTVRYFPMEERFAEFLAYLRSLYQEKLLDPDGFYTADALRVSADSAQDATYGVFLAPTPLSLYPFEQARQYTLLPPLAWEGKRVYRGLTSPVTGGTFAITSACEDPAALLEWVDWLYTEEGAIQALAGTLGTDYRTDAEGRWQWAGGLEGTTARTLSQLSVYDTGNMPWLFPLDFYNRYEEPEVGRINEALASLAPCLVNPFAYGSLTREQRDTILPLQDELGRFVDENMARFVLGQQALSEENLAAFRDGLSQRGAEAFLREWQAIYEETYR